MFPRVCFKIQLLYVKAIFILHWGWGDKLFSKRFHKAVITQLQPLKECQMFTAISPSRSICKVCFHKQIPPDVHWDCFIIVEKYQDTIPSHTEVYNGTKILLFFVWEVFLRAASSFCLKYLYNVIKHGLLAYTKSNLETAFVKMCIEAATRITVYLLSLYTKCCILNNIVVA